MNLERPSRSALFALGLALLALPLAGGLSGASLFGPAVHFAPSPRSLAPSVALRVATSEIADGRNAPSASPCGFSICILPQLGMSTTVGSFSPTTDFNTGSVGNQNEVFFQLCDFALDHSANITINDPNATADHLTNPVLSLTVPLVLAAGTGCPGGTSFDSTLAPRVFFTVPRTLVLGGTWTFNVTASTSSWSMQQMNFHVDTYFVQLTPDQVDHLPKDRATLFYQVLSFVSQGPVSGTLAFGANGLYVNSTVPGVYAPLPPLTPPVGTAQGQISFLIPANALPGGWVAVNLWANLSSGGRTNVETSQLTYTVAEVIAPELCAATTTDGGPNPCPNPLAFPLGSEIVVRETAVMGSPGGGLLGTIPGAAVSIQLFSSGIPLPAPGAFPTQLTADASGTAREVLDTSLLKVSSVTVNVTVADPQDPSLTNHSSLTISLLGNSSQVAVVISLNSTQYFGGDTLGGTFRLVLPGGGGTIPAYWTVYAYQVLFLAGSPICPPFPTGALEEQQNVTGSSGNLPPYALAPSMQGVVEVVLYAHNGSSPTSLGIFSMACALVSPPQLLVNPSEVSYLPGDAITVSLTGEGSLFTTGHPIFYANVVGFASVTGFNPCSGNTMQVLFGGAVSQNTFSFQIPQQGASICYEVSVSAETSGGFVSGEDVELDEVTGYSLSAAVTTPSQYSDGSYQPGESLSLAYSISALGSSTLPRTVVLFVQMGIEPATRTQQASTSGSITVTVPSGAGSGLLLIYVEALVADPSAPGGLLAISTVTGLMVHANPSWVGQELTPGGGMTYGDLAVLIAVVAVIAVALLLWWRGRWDRPREHFRVAQGAGGEVPPVAEPETAPVADVSSAPVAPGAPSSDDIAPTIFPDLGPSIIPQHHEQQAPPPLPPPVQPGPPTP